MEWQSDAVVLSMRPHGESAAIIEVLSALHGFHAGVLRGGAGRRMAPHVQAGTQVRVVWRARLSEQIGRFDLEPVRARAGLFGDVLGLSGLNAVCALLRVALPERVAVGAFYNQTIALIDAMERGLGWPADYLRWERDLLEVLGFGLDLTCCAVTGAREDLAYVSPKTGRAVARDAAGAWADRLFALPPALLGQGAADAREMGQGLAITGHFLQRGLEVVLAGRPLPEARARLVARLISAESQIAQTRAAP